MGSNRKRTILYLFSRRASPPRSQQETRAFADFQNQPIDFQRLQITAKAILHEQIHAAGMAINCSKSKEDEVGWF
jgi:hypothetical protein